MATEVLLLAKVNNLGQEGDVVTVADGYARNYLLPRNLGAPVTQATRRRLAKIQAEREVKRKAELTEAQQAVAKFTNVSVTIPVKTGEDSQLYGSVTVNDIMAALTEQGIEMDRRCLVLDNPIKELGVYDIEVRLHTEVSASIKVWVVEE